MASLSLDSDVPDINASDSQLEKSPARTNLIHYKKKQTMFVAIPVHPHLSEPGRDPSTELVEQEGRYVLSLQ